MSTSNFTLQNADQSLRNLNVSRHLTASNVVAGNVSTNTINGASVTDLLAGVDVVPGDDVQAALDNAAAKLLPGTKGAMVFLAIGEYPDTSLLIPDGVNVGAYQPGASFPNLVRLGFKNSTDGTGEGEYIVTNIQFTLNNSNTDSIVEMPTANTSSYVQLSGNASITSSSTTAPLIAWNQSTSLNLVLRSGTSLTMTDPTQTAIYGSSGTADVDVMFGSSVNGKIDLNGTVQGTLTVGGTLNAGNDTNTSLNLTTSGTYDLVNDYSTVIGQRDVSGLDSNVHKFGVLYDKGQDQVILPTIVFDTTVTTSSLGSLTYTADQIVGGIIVRNSLDLVVSDTLPTAANLVLATPNAFIGSTLTCKIVNTGAGAITLGVGSGATIVGNPVIASGTSQVLYVRITSIDGGSPSYVVYM